MEVVSFSAERAASIAGWATSPVERRRWCGADEVGADTVAGWAMTDDVEAVVVEIDGEPVGYGELWIDDDEREVELAHIIVAPSHRNAGLGRRLVDELVVRGYRHQPTVTLRVVPDNHSAIRCYSAAGFVRAAAEDEAAWNLGQPRDYAWMLHRRADTG